MPTDDRARVPADVSVPEMERLLALALARGGRVRRPLLRAPPHLVAPAGGGHHPHRLRGRDLRPGRARGLGRADRLRLHRRPLPAGHGPRRETAAHIASDSRTVPPQAVSPAPVDRRYGPRPSPCSTSPRASRSSSGPTAPPAPTTRASRRWSPPWPTRPSRSASRTRSGVLAEDVQPLFSIRVSVIAREGAVRREGRRAAAAASAPSSSTSQAARVLRAGGGAHGHHAAGREGGAGRDRCPSCSAPAGRASSSTRRSATASRATSTARAPPPSPGRIGQRVASPGVTVVDDGSIPDRRGSLNVDDEGNVPGRTVLIEDGILRGYLQDRLNSGLMKMTATGNGRRQGYGSIPLPRMTNTFMLAGQDDPEDIIRSVPRGLYAEALRRRAGGHHQRQVRVLRHRGLPDRGRQDRPARGRGDADRQRARHPDQGDAHRPRPEARRGRRASARRPGRTCPSAWACPPSSSPRSRSAARGVRRHDAGTDS